METQSRIIKIELSQNKCNSFEPLKKFYLTLIFTNHLIYLSADASAHAVFSEENFSIPKKKKTFRYQRAVKNQKNYLYGNPQHSRGSRRRCSTFETNKAHIETEFIKKMQQIIQQKPLTRIILKYVQLVPLK